MRTKLGNTPTRTDAKNIPSVFCFFAGLISAILCGCSDFLQPVESTPAPTEYSYNYWLLTRTYLFEDELKNLDEDGDSTQLLYAELEDPFTRYVPPSKSESASISINTSIVQGDVGMEYFLNPGLEHPLCIYRVYPEGPASNAGVPRYGCILKVNDVELKEESAEAVRKVYSTYDSVLTYNKLITLVVQHDGDTASYEMEKGDVYAPTVFVDTLEGTTIITISEFKQTTIDKAAGSFGELKNYLDSTRNSREPRLIDLRGNPGGHVTQCVAMADLFIKEGPISTRSWRTFDANGKPFKKSVSVEATPGDAGEGHQFVALVNRNSASCAEIFTAALAEGAGIPVVGSSTYGKGIGQTTWKTMAGGLALITNLEFLTPKGNSYHKKGIAPDKDCGSEAPLTCGINYLRNKYGTKTSILKKSAVFKADDFQIISRKQPSLGGAFRENDDPKLDLRDTNN